MKPLKKLLSALMALLLLASLSAPAAFAADKVYREATADVSIREGGNSTFKVVTTLPKGDVVEVVATTMWAPWWKVKYTNSDNKTYEGYVDREYLKETSKRSNKKKNTAPLGCYSASTSLNLRSGRGSSYKSKTTVPAGNVVNVTDTTDEVWYKCTFINKKGKKYTGFLSSAYLKKAAEPYKVKSKTQLRSSASSSSKNLQTLPKGSYLLVTQVYSSKWFKVDYPDINGAHHTGYVLKSKVKKTTITNKPYKQVDPEAEAKWMAKVWRSKTRYKLTAKTKLTSSASKKGKKVATLSKGTVVAVGGSSGKYYKVVWNNSKNKKKLGYLPKSKLKKFKDSKAGDYVTTAQTELRKDDSQTSEVLVKLKAYTLFQVVDSSEKNWLWATYKDSNGKKHTGFVYKKHAKRYVEKNAGNYYAKVATELRKTASDTGSVLKELQEGYLVKVKKTYNPNWYYVTYTDKNGNTSKGYVASAHLSKFQSLNEDYVAVVSTVMRNQPNDSAETTADIPEGQAVTVNDTPVDGWVWASFKDEYGEKHTGFVDEAHLMTKEEYEEQEESEKSAQEQQSPEAAA